ncbi:hypothetical protein AXZ95_0577 [Leifsonia sp. 115AMFTsu3.1]|nr:hypothetical protein AXZ95_0577 [Leifsonia sp. 115AMFTsu3.1]
MPAIRTHDRDGKLAAGEMSTPCNASPRSLARPRRRSSRLRNVNWWAQFWAALAAPGWWATMLQSLIGAGIALGAAVIVLRRQLRHDRAIARDQRLQDLEQAAADRSADRAEMIGRRIYDGLDAPMYTSDETLDIALRSDPLPGWRELREVDRELGLVVANPFVVHPYFELLQTRELLWLQAVQLIRALRESSDFERDSFAYPFEQALKRVLYPSEACLRRFASDLVVWDGHGDWPVPSEIHYNGQMVTCPPGEGRSAWLEERKQLLRSTMFDFAKSDLPRSL